MPLGAGRARIYGRLGVVATVVTVADQTTKQLALDRLEGDPIDVVEGILTLRLTYNSGGAFGLGRGLPWLFLAATGIIVAVLLVWAGRAGTSRIALPLGLVVGGGIGNVIDRVVRDLGGRVVDFVDFHVWPVFNVADAAIVCGVGLILLGSLLDESHGNPPGPEAGSQ